MLRHVQKLRWCSQQLPNTQIKPNSKRVAASKQTLSKPSDCWIGEKGPADPLCYTQASGAGSVGRISKFLKLQGSKRGFPGSFSILRHTKNFTTTTHFGTPFSTSSANKKDAYITVRLPSGEQTLHPLWLREHCRCQHCFNSMTSQRYVDFTDFAADLKPDTCHVEGEDLVIIWPDNHLTRYSLKWLEETWNSSGGVAPTDEASGQVLWDKQVISVGGPSPVDYSAYMTTEEGLKQHVNNLLTYGYSFIQDCPVSPEATDAACDRLCHPYETFFGRRWTFTSDMSADDTSYTSESLGAHTDNTYLEQPAGLQVLHCLEHDGGGGLNLLLDGFHVANILKRDYLESFQTLTLTPIKYEYLGKDVRTHSFDPVIKLHPATQEVVQIKYNSTDRPPRNTIPNDQLPAFYTALRHFVRHLKDPANELWFKLHPGTVLFFDNFRLLHGRSEFTGKRIIHGCYLSRDNWLSKARVLGLL